MRRKWYQVVSKYKEVWTLCERGTMLRYTYIVYLYSSACVTTANLRYSFFFFFLLWRCDPTRVMASSFLRFLDHTQRRSTVVRTHLDEWSARRRDLYLTTHDTHNRQHIHASGGIRTHDLSRRAAAELRLRPRGRWDRLLLPLYYNI